jgi:hypothetical protein
MQSVRAVGRADLCSIATFGAEKHSGDEGARLHEAQSAGSLLFCAAFLRLSCGSCGICLGLAQKYIVGAMIPIPLKSLELPLSRRGCQPTTCGVSCTLLPSCMCVQMYCVFWNNIGRVTLRVLVSGRIATPFYVRLILQQNPAIIVTRHSTAWP